jgi:hypothetical protein
MVIKQFLNLFIILSILTITWSSKDSPLSSTTAKWSIGSFVRRNNVSLEFQVAITSPSSPGTYPVIFFLTGFDGLAPSFFYSDFITRFVSDGNYIIIAFDKLRFIEAPTKEEAIFEITLDWAIENLIGLFDSEKTPFYIRNQVFPDQGPNGFTLMSHSSAAHPIALYLYNKCGPFKKLVLMDPVGKAVELRSNL